MDLQNILAASFQLLPDIEADRILTQVVSADMSDKLHSKREDGRGGWHTRECTNKELTEMLKAHIDKGDMIDVINFAGMIHVRKLAFGDSA